ncbi:MAG: hypothetical protein AB1921_19555 [Thermodesulfobacteriota bacterium]
MEPDEPYEYEKDVEDLFADLGVVEGRDAAPAPAAVPGLIETLHEQEGRQDPVRVLLAHFVQEAAGMVRASQSPDPKDKEKAAERLTAVLRKLASEDPQEPRVLLRHRGRGDAADGKESQFVDYEVHFGTLRLDPAQLKTTARRLGPTAAHLHPVFVESLKALALLGINTLYVTLNPEAAANASDPYRLRQFMASLGAYFNVAAAPPETEVALADETGLPPIIYDEKRKPSPNFTTLAAVNGLRRGTVQVLVNQVDSMMHRAGARDPLLIYCGVYDAVFAFKKLVGILKRPPLEVNNLRWLLSSRPEDPVGEKQALVARLVSREFGDWSQKPARILAALYGQDYGSLCSWQLAERLGLVTELLETMEIASSASMAQSGQADLVSEENVEEVLSVMERNLEKAPDEIYDQLHVSGDTVEARVSDAEPVKRYVDRRLLAQVAFFRQRSATNRKMKSLLRHGAEFDTADYQAVARDFGVSEQDAVELVGLLARCFDTNGHFLRKAFEKSVPAFCRHEKKVFEFLWYYLREHMGAEDRISLLNALLLLINRMRRPREAIAVLLTGLVRDPETLAFSDRNALMLANVLLRKYNKELTKDIRMTPEEVLHVRDGLDREAAAFAAGILDEKRDEFFVKVRTVHRQVKAALNPYTWHEAMPLGYLLTLERETYMFLALTGGGTAQAVLRSALWEYGNPESEIYRLAERRDQFQWLLHLFQVVVRGVGRVGGALDVPLLAEVKAKGPEFSIMAIHSGTREQLNRLMEWVDRATEALGSRKAAKSGQ